MDTRVHRVVVAGQAEAAAPLSESEFQEVYRRHARALWAYLYRLTGNAADADDLLQDAFCRLLTASLATREDGELRAYLFRVASNAAIDAWRRRKFETARADADRAEGPGSHQEADSLRRYDLGRTFRELKPRERVLLWLAYVEGSEHREIARSLGVRTASVPVMLFRARRKLAALLRRKGLVPEER